MDMSIISDIMKNALKQKMLGKTMNMPQGPKFEIKRQITELRRNKKKSESNDQVESSLDMSKYSLLERSNSINFSPIKHE